MVMAIMTRSSATKISIDVEILFEKFMLDFEKNYANFSEMAYRLEVFAENVQHINAHNNASSSYKKGINKFSDLTSEEFAAQFLTGYKAIAVPGQQGLAESAFWSDMAESISDLPESVDWKERGVMTSVKDQGSCGSCWAFAATALVESYVAIETDKLEVLSTQQMTSCTPNPLECGGYGGCFGALAQLGFGYVQLFGQTTEESYPYVSGSTCNTERCSYDLTGKAPVAGITGYNTLPSNNMEAVMQHLAEVGPLAVSVAAHEWGMYESGVFDGCSYDENIDLSHAVVLAGYGTDPLEGDYWLVRNSWGESWGEDGYIRMRRDSDLNCGVNTSPSHGTACTNGPGNDEQKVCGRCGILFDASYPIGAHTK